MKSSNPLAIAEQMSKVGNLQNYAQILIRRHLIKPNLDHLTASHLTEHAIYSVIKLTKKFQLAIIGGLEEKAS